MRPLLLVTGFVLIVTGVTGMFLFYGKNNAPWEIIPNPIITLNPLEETEFKPSWRDGYTFLPFSKEKRHDGAILLNYKGTIANDSLSMDLYGVDFETSRKEGNSWIINDIDTNTQKTIQCPEVTLGQVNHSEFESYYPDVYQSYPLSKNLQPDGRVILSAGVKITNDIFSVILILPACYDFKSIKIQNEHFVMRKDSRECLE